MDILGTLQGLPYHSPKTYGSGRWIEDLEHFPRYAEVFARISPNSMLEIGAFTGYSICTAAIACDTLARIEWIDNESGCRDSNKMVAGNLQAVDPDILVAYWRTKEEATPTLPVDLIHIDADHSYEAVKSDLEWASQLCPRWIIGHDYELPGSGVKEAVVEFLGREPLTYPVTNGLYIIPADWTEGFALFGGEPVDLEEDDECDELS